MSIPRDPNHPGFPVHPGSILREDFLVPLNLSANALSIALRVPSTRITEIVAERRGITADTAYRLAAYFGGPASFWMNLQANYELAITYKQAVSVINKEVRRRVA
ncbi:HigA family addiction module antitoxin [Terriglobus saanensis]|uniref:Putative plasmid maintenance system antidote protein, XRE family n=1 Tax=Terriglobus saanensis (strain ATCC BAA-1853 / DSM 23119 / SP1PR4) TaxID=401053 RepID=E8V5X0_TERSS|nr:HigA family addiction module antitoxin [Terriglobus saanensis]ADV83788.1 putative plasmid maintenance system antidote protein, XRE family [Terriglobus saanensis SP1PR4]